MYDFDCLVFTTLHLRCFAAAVLLLTLEVATTTVYCCSNAIILLLATISVAPPPLANCCCNQSPLFAAGVTTQSVAQHISPMLTARSMLAPILYLLILFHATLSPLPLSFCAISL